MSRLTPPRLIGRQAERDTLDELLTSAMHGRSASLVLRGEAGIGKSALLEYLIERATDFQVLSAHGVESDMELPFAGLQQLCAPLLSHLAQLPEPQRDALSTAFGLTDGPRPDKFLVGLAVLTLLGMTAASKPVLCVIEGAQSLDRSSTEALGFVARRVADEQLAIIFALREPSSAAHLDGIRDLAVRGLSEAESHALLARVLPTAVERRIRDRIVSEANGNPLALLELPSSRDLAELLFGDQNPAQMPVATRIERDFQRRLELLPEVTRRLLLLAAAEPVGDPVLLWRAALRMGIAIETAPAEEAGLVYRSTSVRFRHPLVRSAVYRAATLEDRRLAHAALAEATDADADPDRRAWHRAQASPSPDEAIASELEASADRAYRRGGIAAAAALLDRAAALTPDAGRRGARALAAAEAAYAAAMPDMAGELIAVARMSPLDELQRARMARLEAQLVFARTRSSEAARLMLEAARRFEPLDPNLAREAYREAMTTAIVGAKTEAPYGVRAIAVAVHARTPSKPAAIPMGCAA